VYVDVGRGGGGGAMCTGVVGVELMGLEWMCI
jgi:hypothetical protein